LDRGKEKKKKEEQAASKTNRVQQESTSRYLEKGKKKKEGLEQHQYRFRSCSEKRELRKVPLPAEEGEKGGGGKKREKARPRLPGTTITLVPGKFKRGQPRHGRKESRGKGKRGINHTCIETKKGGREEHAILFPNAEEKEEKKGETIASIAITL